MYSYANQRAEVFSESGQVIFLKVRDNARRLFKLAGAVRMTELVADCSGSNWTILACVDRMEELGEIRRADDGKCATQNQVYVRGSLPL